MHQELHNSACMFIKVYCSSFQSYSSADRFWPEETLALQYTLSVSTEQYSWLGKSLLVLTKLWEIGHAF